MMQAKEFRDLCKEVAAETGQSTEAVMEMVKDSFDCAQKHISKGSLTQVYFQYLGRFEVQEGRKNYLKTIRDKHDSKQPELPDKGDTDTTP
jgi:nucleoid DNA-binding protein